MLPFLVASMRGTYGRMIELKKKKKKKERQTRPFDNPFTRAPDPKDIAKRS